MLADTEGNRFCIVDLGHEHAPPAPATSGRAGASCIGWPCRYICGGLFPAVWPPSIGMTVPVMNEDCGEHSQSTVCGHLGGVPIRRIGVDSAASRCACSPAASR